MANQIHKFTEKELATRKLHRSPNEILRKIVTLLDNKASEDIIDRQLQYISDFFEDAEFGYYLQDLPHVMRILEILSKRMNHISEFRKPFQLFLSRCAVAPMMRKSSEILDSSKLLEEYFSLIASFAFQLEDEHLKFIIIEAIEILLLNKKFQLPKCCVAQEKLLEAAGASCLPAIVSGLLIIVDDKIYEKLIRIVGVLAKHSDEICHKLLREYTLDHLLTRWEPSWRKRNIEIPPNEPHTKSIVQNYEETYPIIWILLDSIEDTDAEFRQNLPQPNRYALWSLRYALKYFCKTRGKDIDRNNVVALVLKILSLFSKSHLVSSGIAEDICVLNVCGEHNTVDINRSWARSLKFTPSNELFNLKKLLLLCLPFYYKYQAFGGDKYVKFYNVIKYKLLILEDKQAINWHPDHKNSLKIVTLGVLMEILKPTLSTFKAEGGPYKMFYMLKNYKELPIDVIGGTLKAITTTLYVDDATYKEYSKWLVENGAAEIMFEYCDGLLAKEVFSECFQKNVSWCFCILHCLLSEVPIATSFGLKVCMDFIQRLITPQIKDPQVDPRYIVAAISCLHQGFLAHEDNVLEFFRKGGPYLLLDIIQACVLPVKIVSLALLADIGQLEETVPFLITWRGKDNKKIIPLLMGIFREENEQIQVKLSASGIILDPSLPLMGEMQRKETFEDKLYNGSPAIIDMIASCRPKIYAIIHYFDNYHAEKIEKANSIYKLYDENLGSRDQITMLLAYNYFPFKMAEVWQEVILDLKKLGVHPLERDENLLNVMTTRSIKWGEYLKFAQEEVLNAEDDKERISETMYFNELKHSYLADALDALKELDYIARCSNANFRIKAKAKHIREIKASEKIQKPVVDTTAYHPTFTYKPATNAVFNLYLQIESNKIVNALDALIENKRRKKMKMLSPREDTFHHPDLPEDLLCGSISDIRCFEDEI